MIRADVFRQVVTILAVAARFSPALIRAQMVTSGTPDRILITCTLQWRIWSWFFRECRGRLALLFIA